MNHLKEGQAIPDVTFHTRHDHEWIDVESKDLFAGKYFLDHTIPYQHGIPP